jgi:hypothetical protein
MDMSDKIDALAAALATAQETISGAIKDSNNPHFRSKYADLASVWEAWQKVGPANGLAVAQWTGPTVDGKMSLTTVLTHKSGQWMRETMTVPLPKQDPQGYGSAATYSRRYALAAVAGIAPEDDDGNAASKVVPRPADMNPAQDEAGGKDDVAAKWQQWARDRWKDLDTIEADGNGEALAAWLFKHKANLVKLEKHAGEAHEKLTGRIEGLRDTLRTPQTPISAG